MSALKSGHTDFDVSGMRAVRIAGGTAVCLGVAVLVGWALDIPWLKSVMPDLPPLKANAALGFICLGISLLGHRSRNMGLRTCSQAAACLLLALGLATFAEQLLYVDLGIDELLFRDPLSPSSRLLQPGRMSPLAAVSFIFLSAALLQSCFSSPLALGIRQLCLLVPLLLSARTLVGLLYGAPLLYTSLKSPMALHAAIVFLVVSVALLLAERDFYLARLWHGSAAGSALGRRMLVWTVTLPLAIGLACLHGERLGLYPATFGATVFAVLIALVLVGLLVAWAGQMNQLDRERQLASTAAKEFRKASELDHLTGLLNRRGFLERGQQLLAQSRRDGSCVACLVLDIDFFKKVNDVHGHATGDEVIRQFAIVLKGGCGAGDIVGRVGGEEFCVLLRAEEHTARQRAEWLRGATCARPFALSAARLSITCSVGVAELRPYHQGAHALIDSADAALLVAKQTGRNKVVTASSLEEADVGGACSGPLRRVLVRDIMVPVLASLRLNTTVAVAAQRLMELNLDTLPVLDESGKVTGFVTEQDVMTAMLDAHGGDQPIANCNHFSVAVFEDNVAAEEIATFFSRSAVQRVVIIRQGAPVGLVSRRTLLRWLLNHSLDRQSESRAGSGTGPLPPSRFVESIHELAGAVSRLTKLDADDCEELLSSSVVSEATRIQESVENLLISCRPRRMPARTNEQLATGAMSIA